MIARTVRAILILLLLIVIMIGVVLVVEPNFNLATQRAPISQALSRWAGREIQLGGDIRIALGRHSRIAIQDVRISNPDWASAPDLLHAAEVAGGIDLLAMLSGVMHLQGLQLRDAVVALQVSPDGERSWDFSPAKAGESTEKPGAGSPLVIEDARLENVAVAFQDRETAQPIKIHLDHFNQRNDAGNLVLDAMGQVNGLPLQIGGRLGTLDALIQGRAIDVDLSAALDDAVLTLGGQLGVPAKLEDISLEAAVRGPSLTHILTALGIPYSHPGGIDARLQITDQPQGFSWTASGRLGTLQVDTQGSVQQPLVLDGLRASIDLSGKDLAVLGNLARIQGLPNQPYALRGEIQREGGKLEINDVNIETGRDRIRLEASLSSFPRLNAGKAQFTVSIPEPKHYAALMGNNIGGAGALQIEAKLTAGDGGESQIDAQISLGSNTAQLNGKLGNYPDYRQTQLDFLLAGQRIDSLAAAAGLSDLPARPYRVAGSVTVDTKGLLLLHLTEGTVGDLQVSADGSLGPIPKLQEMNLAIKANGPSLQAFGGRLAETRLPDQPFRLETRLRGSPAAPVLVDTAAFLGDAAIETEGTIALAPGLAGTDLRFTLTVPDLARLIPGAADSEWGHKAYQAAGGVRTIGGTLQLHDVAVSGDKMKMQLSATIPASLNIAGTRLKLLAEISDLAAVVPASAIYTPPKAPLMVELQFNFGEDALEIEKALVELAEIRLIASGSMRAKAAAGGGDLLVKAHGPRLSDLGRIQGIVLPAESFDISATVNHAGNRTRISDLTANISNRKLSGELLYEQRGRPFIDLNLTGGGINLSEFMVAETQAADATSHTAETTPSDRRIIPDQPVSLEVLDALDAHLRIKVSQLAFPDPVFHESTLFDSMQLEARLQDGNLTVDSWKATGNRGDIGGSIRLLRNGRVISTDWKLKASNYRIGILSAGVRLIDLPAHEIDMNLAARGSTYRELAASMNGRLRMTGGAGKTVNAGIDRVFGEFFDELLAYLLPLKEKETYTRLDCMAAAIDVKNGIVQMLPGAVIRTDKVDISATGTLDLRSEQINVQFRNAPRKGIGLSVAGLVHPFIKVGGTLARPALILKTQEALISGTVAAATGGLSLIAGGLIARLSTADNPCARIIEQAESTNETKPSKSNSIKAPGTALQSSPSKTPSMDGRKPASILDQQH